jgi:hypothetical protein
LQTFVINRSHRRDAILVSRSRLFWIVVCLLAFVFQGYVAQTHIHVPLSQDNVVIAQKSSLAAKLPTRAPDQTPQEDLSKCPLCQVISAIGAALSSNSIYFVQLEASGIVVALREFPRPERIAPAHVWESRGPPQV